MLDILEGKVRKFMTFCDSIICYLQFLFGLAHVMKLPLFRQACELAFAERKAVGNDCILEHEVYCSLPLFCFLNVHLEQILS